MRNAFVILVNFLAVIATAAIVLLLAFTLYAAAKTLTINDEISETLTNHPHPTMRVHCVTVTGRHSESEPANVWYFDLDAGTYYSDAGAAYIPPYGATCSRS